MNDIREEERLVLGLLGISTHLGEVGKKFIENLTRNSLSEYKEELTRSVELIQKVRETEFDFQKVLGTVENNIRIIQSMVEEIEQIVLF
jgi:hypothetical protein